MAELSDKHIDLITKEVNKAGISFSHLQIDLIDHICCDVENGMNQGLSFDRAFANAKQQFGVGGLQRIQEETLLLIDKTYRIMKTTMKIFGVAAPFIVALGTLFKIEHWPGAGILITLGFFLLAFVFLPSAVYVSYREVSNQTKKLAHISGFIAGFLLSISFLFKIQHWPGTSLMMLAGILITGFILLPSVFIDKIKSAETGGQRTIYSFGWVGSFIYLLGFLFKVNHWPGASIMLLSGSLLFFLIAFPLYVYAKYKNEETIAGSFIFLTVVAAWILLPTMLITLNLSVNALRSFEEIRVETANHIQYASSSNSVLYKQVKSSAKNGSEISISMIDSLKMYSDEVVDYIENVKVELESLSYETNESDAISKVFFGPENEEAKKINDKLIDYQQIIINMLPLNADAAPIIKTILGVTDAKNVLQGSAINESQLKSTKLIIALNKLTGLQDNVRVAEGFLLREFVSKHTFIQSQPNQNN